MVKNKSIVNNYIELLRAIKNTKIDKDYNPKDYDFNLDSFNKENKKKESKTL